MSDPKSKFSARFHQLLDKHGYPPKNSGRIALVAEKFNVSHKGAANWLNGISLPSRKKIKIICESFDVAEGWLLFSNRPMEGLGYFKAPVLRSDQILDFLNGTLTHFDTMIDVQDLVGRNSFVVSIAPYEFDVEFLVSSTTKLVFDPDKKPADKLFSLIVLDGQLSIKRLIEFEKEQFLVNESKPNSQPQFRLLKENETPLATLAEIRF